MPHPQGPCILFSILLAGCNTNPPPVAPVVEEDPAAKIQATLDAIEAARQAAHSRYMDCQVDAESAYNNRLHEEGTPSKTMPGAYTERYPGAFEKLQQQQNFDDTECRKVYEAELGLIQPRLQPQEEPSK